MQTNVQIDTKALRHSPEHGKGGKGGSRFTAELIPVNVCWGDGARQWLSDARAERVLPEDH